MARIRILTDQRFPGGRIQVYGGGGLGPTYSFVKVSLDNQSNRDKASSLILIYFIGGKIFITKKIALFIETKGANIDQAQIELLKGLDTDLDINFRHIYGGLAYHIFRD